MLMLFHLAIPGKSMLMLTDHTHMQITNEPHHTTRQTRIARMTVLVIEEKTFDNRKLGLLTPRANQSRLTYLFLIYIYIYL